MFCLTFFICNFFVCASTVNGLEKAITDDQLKKFSSELLKSDGNVASVSYHLQGKQRSNPTQVLDLASEPLFETIPANILQRSTYQKFMKLLDNYDRRVEMAEVVTNEEEQEINDFLSSVVKTTVMQKLKQFLIQQGKLNSNADFAQLLEKLWFHHYPRSGNVKGSSGFEHVFVGEIKNKAISGLHNWLQFYLLEKNKAVNYQGFTVHLTLEKPVTFLKYNFAWDKYTKPTSSMFIGTSPEFEMALYTLCFMVRPDTTCTVQFGTKTLKIKTFSLKYKGQTYIGSAFPSL